MAPLVEGRDYYVENGVYVFTADFLQRRGYCCRSGCRHCPYGFRPGREDAASKPLAGDEPATDRPDREKS
jgi:Family of unknown function (DUF5522)